jgi:hypothetical protein
VAKNPHRLSLVKKAATPAAESAGTEAQTTVSSSDVDELYQKPLGEFTAARNALAKRLGKDGAEVKILEKPSAPAWAVNQLFWRDRASYDQLVEASEALRAEHRKHLSGKTADIRSAEKAHRDAVKASSDTIRRLLSAAGETASAATMTAVTETLEALPTADPPGRLVHPLKPGGFETLAGLAARPATEAPREKRKDDAVAPAAQTEAARKREDAARRAAEEAERAAAEERARRREAHASAVRDAEAAVERARAALDEAHQEVERRSEALAGAREALRQLKRVTVI